MSAQCLKRHCGCCFLDHYICVNCFFHPGDLQRRQGTYFGMKSGQYCCFIGNSCNSSLSENSCILLAVTSLFFCLFFTMTHLFDEKGKLLRFGTSLIQIWMDGDCIEVMAAWMEIWLLEGWIT